MNDEPRETLPPPDLSFVRLSPQEARVIELYDRGYSLKEIADALGISTNTVKTHCSRILAKLAAWNMRRAAWLLRSTHPALPPISDAQRVHLFSKNS